MRQRTASRDYTPEMLAGMTGAELIAELRSMRQALPSGWRTASYIADAESLIAAELSTR